MLLDKWSIALLENSSFDDFLNEIASPTELKMLSMGIVEFTNSFPDRAIELIYSRYESELWYLAHHNALMTNRTILGYIASLGEVNGAIDLKKNLVNIAAVCISPDLLSDMGL